MVSGGGPSVTTGVVLVVVESALVALADIELDAIPDLSAAACLSLFSRISRLMSARRPSRIMVAFSCMIARRFRSFRLRVWVILILTGKRLRPSSKT